MPKYLVHRYRVFLLLLLLNAGPAAAQDSVPESRKLSLTISPLHLLVPILKLTGEYRLNPSWSVATMAKAGKEYGAENGRLIGLGLQGRQYPFRPSRHEPHVGVEAMFWTIDDGQTDGMVVSEAEHVFTLTPFLGYKYTAPLGLTLEAQLGLGLGVIRQTYEYPEFTSVNTNYWPALLLNLNAGWSF